MLNIFNEKTDEDKIFSSLMEFSKKTGKKVVDYTCINYLDVPWSKNVPRYYIAIEFEEDQDNFGENESLILDQFIQQSNPNYQHQRIQNCSVIVLKKGSFHLFKLFIFSSGSNNVNQIKIPRLLKKPEHIDFILNLKLY